MMLKTALTAIGTLAMSTGWPPSFAVSPASAAVTTISSSSTVLDISLIVPPGVLSITLGPVLPAAGSAPPPYDVTNSNSLSFPLLGLSSSLVTDTASSPHPPTETGTATSTADSFFFAPVGGALFSVSATTISSTSSVTGTPTPSAAGSTTITGLSLTIAGHTFTFSGTPSPNDVIFSEPGLAVILNQQIPDTTETAGITTNAVAIDFNNFALGSNHVSGAVDVGQSMASIAVIPEPATWAMMLAGFAGLGFAGYRASRKSAAIAA
jgi:PEP-CTERM motif